MPLVSCFSPPDIFTFTPSPPPTEKTSGPTWKLATMPIPIHPTNPRTNDTKLKTGVLKWLAWFCFSTILYLVYIVAAPEKEGHLDEFLFDFLEWKTQREFCIAFSKFVLFNFLIAIGSPLAHHSPSSLRLTLSPVWWGHTHTYTHTPLLPLSHKCYCTCIFLWLAFFPLKNVPWRSCHVSTNRSTSSFLEVSWWYIVRCHIYFIILLIIDFHIVSMFFLLQTMLNEHPRI